MKFNERLVQLERQKETDRKRKAMKKLYSDASLYKFLKIPGEKMRLVNYLGLDRMEKQKKSPPPLI